MMIHCPECGKLISDEAELCPDCGFMIGLFTEPSEQKNTENMDTAYIDKDFLQNSQFFTVHLPDTAANSPAKKPKKRIIRPAFIWSAVIVVIAAAIMLLAGYYDSINLHIETIRIGKQIMVHEDDYRSPVSSNETKPFIAVLENKNTDQMDQHYQCIYMVNGSGTIYDDFPDIDHTVVGYLSGEPVSEEEISVDITYQYSQSSSSEHERCDIYYDVQMNPDRNGLLFYEAEEHTTHGSIRNICMTIIDGKGRGNSYCYDLNDDRSISETLIPRLFIPYTELSSDDYCIESAFECTIDEHNNGVSYSGSEAIHLNDHTEGIVLYINELKSDGDYWASNRTQYDHAYIKNSTSDLTTYNYYYFEDHDFIAEAPVYEITPVGYINWTDFQNEQ